VHHLLGEAVDGGAVGRVEGVEGAAPVPEGPRVDHLQAPQPGPRALAPSPRFLRGGMGENQGIKVDKRASKNLRFGWWGVQSLARLSMNCWRTGPAVTNVALSSGVTPDGSSEEFC